MPTYDAMGHPLCPMCLRPMERVEQRDHFTAANAKQLVFECEDCDAVEMKPALVPSPTPSASSLHS